MVSCFQERNKGRETDGKIRDSYTLLLPPPSTMSREWDRGKGYDDRYDDRDRDWERDRDYDRARSGHVRYREDEDEAYDERERGGHKRPKHNVVSET